MVPRDFDRTIVGGRLVSHGQAVDADIGVRSGAIAAITAPGDLAGLSEESVDASGLLVLPGLIDAHVHYAASPLGLPDTEADDLAAVGVSAAHGGITTLVPFVAGAPGESVADFLRATIEEGSNSLVTDFAMHCRFPRVSDEWANQVGSAFELGATSFKVAMAYLREGVMWDDVHLFELMEAIARRDGLLTIHAEDGAVIHPLEERALSKGLYGPDTLLETRPSETEADAVTRACMLARRADCRIHIVHLSSAAGLEAILAGRAHGVRVTTETCPQYLTLTDADARRLGRLAKIAPPLREPSDVSALWSGLVVGSIEMVGSDHAPWKAAAKEMPDAYVNVPWGMAGTETMLPIIHSEGVVKGRITVERMVELMAEQPARVFGLYPRKGSITVGADADFVLFDPASDWSIEASALHTGSDYTPYESWKVRGKVVASFLRGLPLLSEGDIVRESGYGEYIARGSASEEVLRA